MPELEVTSSQYERLKEIRSEVEAAFVDDYGHARLEDALQYLLDTYTPPEREAPTADAYEWVVAAEYPALQRVAASVEGVPGSGIEADEMRGRLLRELGPAEFAARLEDSDDTEEEVPGETMADQGAAEETTADREAADGEKPECLGTTAASGDESETASEEANTGGSSGGLLSTPNRLLDEHADKWRENDEGDEPYAVDLPDGSIETVRTKDDVRKLLFQKY